VQLVEATSVSQVINVCLTFVAYFKGFLIQNQLYTRELGIKKSAIDIRLFDLRSHIIDNMHVICVIEFGTCTLLIIIPSRTSLGSTAKSKRRSRTSSNVHISLLSDIEYTRLLTWLHR